MKFSTILSYTILCMSASATSQSAKTPGLTCTKQIFEIPIVRNENFGKSCLSVDKAVIQRKVGRNEDENLQIQKRTSAARYGFGTPMVRYKLGPAVHRPARTSIASTMSPAKTTAVNGVFATDVSYNLENFVLNNKPCIESGIYALRCNATSDRYGQHPDVYVDIVGSSDLGVREEDALWQHIDDDKCYRTV